MRSHVFGAYAIDLEVASLRENARYWLSRCHHGDELASIGDRGPEHPADGRLSVSVMFGDKRFCILEFDLVDTQAIVSVQRIASPSAMMSCTRRPVSRSIHARRSLREHS